MFNVLNLRQTQGTSEGVCTLHMCEVSFWCFRMQLGQEGTEAEGAIERSEGWQSEGPGGLFTQVDTLFDVAW